MEKIRKDGHSFPHSCFCKTCEEDFDEVFEEGIKDMAKEIQNKIFQHKACDQYHELYGRKATCLDMVIHDILEHLGEDEDGEK